MGAASYAVFSLSILPQSRYYFLMGSVFSGWGAGVLWPASTRLLAQYSNKESLGRYLSLQISAVLGGSFIGVYIGSLNLSTDKMNPFFISCAVASFVGAFCFLFLPNAKKVKEKITIKPYYFLSRKMLLIFPFIFSAYYLSASAFSLINLIVLDRFGIEKVGLFSNIFWTGSIVGAFLMTRLTKLKNTSQLLLVLLSVTFLSLLLFAFVNSVSIMFIPILIMGLFTSGVYPIGILLLRKRVPDSEFEYAVGSFNVYLAISVSSAILASNFLQGWLGLVPVFVSIAIAIVFVGKNK
jgi:sugar phosphate permease